MRSSSERKTYYKRAPHLILNLPGLKKRQTIVTISHHDRGESTRLVLYCDFWLNLLFVSHTLINSNSCSMEILCLTMLKKVMHQMRADELTRKVIQIFWGRGEGNIRIIKVIDIFIRLFFEYQVSFPWPLCVSSALHSVPIF